VKPCTTWIHWISGCEGASEVLVVTTSRRTGMDSAPDKSHVLGDELDLSHPPADLTRPSKQRERREKELSSYVTNEIDDEDPSLGAQV
jgi:hypothetical protein